VPGPPGTHRTASQPDQIYQITYGIQLKQGVLRQLSTQRSLQLKYNLYHAQRVYVQHLNPGVPLHRHGIMQMSRTIVDDIDNYCFYVWQPIACQLLLCLQVLHVLHVLHYLSLLP
jgi:hypothetical protein